MKRMHTDEEIQKLAASPIGDVSIDGDLSVDGDFEANSVSADSIIENMSGYTFIKQNEDMQTFAYAGVCKNGNKITFVIAADITPSSTFISNGGGYIGKFGIPSEIYQKLVPFYGSTNYVSYKTLRMVISGSNAFKDVTTRGDNSENNRYSIVLLTAGLTAGTKYYYRYEETFLLSENMIN